MSEQPSNPFAYAHPNFPVGTQVQISESILKSHDRAAHFLSGKNGTATWSAEHLPPEGLRNERSLVPVYILNVGVYFVKPEFVVTGSG